MGRRARVGIRRTACKNSKSTDSVRGSARPVGRRSSARLGELDVLHGAAGFVFRFWPGAAADRFIFWFGAAAAGLTTPGMPSGAARVRVSRRSMCLRSKSCSTTSFANCTDVLTCLDVLLGRLVRRGIGELYDRAIALG